MTDDLPVSANESLVDHRNYVRYYIWFTTAVRLAQVAESEKSVYKRGSTTVKLPKDLDEESVKKTMKKATFDLLAEHDVRPEEVTASGWKEYGKA